MTIHLSVDRTITTSILIGLAISLQACAPAPLDVDLRTPVVPTLPNALVVSGALLAECLAQKPPITGDSARATESHYSYSATYLVAREMTRRSSKTSPYRDKVNGYEYNYEEMSLFGKIHLTRICYYGDSVNGPFFIGKIEAVKGDPIPFNDILRIVYDAYGKFRGSPLSLGEKTALNLGPRT